MFNKRRLKRNKSNNVPTLEFVQKQSLPQKIPRYSESEKAMITKWTRIMIWASSSMFVDTEELSEFFYDGITSINERDIVFEESMTSVLVALILSRATQTWNVTIKENAFKAASCVMKSVSFHNDGKFSDKCICYALMCFAEPGFFVVHNDRELSFPIDCPNGHLYDVEGGVPAVVGNSAFASKHFNRHMGIKFKAQGLLDVNKIADTLFYARRNTLLLKSRGGDSMKSFVSFIFDWVRVRDKPEASKGAYIEMIDALTNEKSKELRKGKATKDPVRDVSLLCDGELYADAGIAELIKVFHPSQPVRFFIMYIWSYHREGFFDMTVPSEDIAHCMLLDQLCKSNKDNTYEIRNVCWHLKKLLPKTPLFVDCTNNPSAFEKDGVLTHAADLSAFSDSEGLYVSSIVKKNCTLVYGSRLVDTEELLENEEREDTAFVGQYGPLSFFYVFDSWRESDLRYVLLMFCYARRSLISKISRVIDHLGEKMIAWNLISDHPYLHDTNFCSLTSEEKNKIIETCSTDYPRIFKERLGSPEDGSLTYPIEYTLIFKKRKQRLIEHQQTNDEEEEEEEEEQSEEEEEEEEEKKEEKTHLGKRKRNEIDGVVQEEGEQKKYKLNNGLFTQNPLIYASNSKRNTMEMTKKGEEKDEIASFSDDEENQEEAQKEKDGDGENKEKGKKHFLPQHWEEDVEDLDMKEWKYKLSELYSEWMSHTKEAIKSYNIPEDMYSDRGITDDLYLPDFDRPYPESWPEYREKWFMSVGYNNQTEPIAVLLYNARKYYLHYIKKYWKLKEEEEKEEEEEEEYEISSGSESSSDSLISESDFDSESMINDSPLQ